MGKPQPLTQGPPAAPSSQTPPTTEADLITTEKIVNNRVIPGQFVNILSFTTATAIDDVAENHALNPGGHFWSDIARMINHYEGIELPPESDFDPSGDLFTLFGPANDHSPSGNNASPNS